MKSKYLILSLLVASASLSSCGDLLDKSPLDELYADVYFNTEEELRLFTNQFYTLAPSAADIYSEQSDQVTEFNPMDEITGQRLIPSEDSNWNFDTLRDINYYLEYSDRCDDEEARNRYDGVARFFRAFFYLGMVQRYGDVPWYDKVLDSDDPDLYKARDSREVVMQNMIADLDFAIENLTEDYLPYEITKWTALALKSRVCLFEGTFRKYHGIDDYDKYLLECVSASETLMNDSSYSLYISGSTPYQDLFAVMDIRSQEVIWGRDYDASLSVKHNVQYYMNSASDRPGLTKKLVNAYLTSTGTRFTDISGYATKSFTDECTNRDPRLAQTIRTPGYTRVSSTTKVAPDLSCTMTGYHLTKYCLGTSYDSSGSSCNDIPIMRYAEVLLNYAEAKAELGVITQTDLDNSINELRSRVGMPDLYLTYANANPDTYLTAVATGYPNVAGDYKGVILEIRRERAVELAAEGFRYYDMMRWREGNGLVQQILGFYVPALGAYDLDSNGSDDVYFYQGTKPSGSVPLYLDVDSAITLTNGTSGNIWCHSTINLVWDEERDYLYPIPTSERVLTGGALTQNPGWEDGLSF